MATDSKKQRPKSIRTHNTKSDTTFKTKLRFIKSLSSPITANICVEFVSLSIPLRITTNGYWYYILGLSTLLRFQINLTINVGVN